MTNPLNDRVVRHETFERVVMEGKLDEMTAALKALAEKNWLIVGHSVDHREGRFRIVAERLLSAIKIHR